MSTRNVQKEIRELLTRISEQTGYPYELVEDIYTHEFEFTSKQIIKGERNKPETFENILLKHFGSFISNEKHIRKLKELQDERAKNKGSIENCL
jgi:hypothetical protein